MYTVKRKPISLKTRIFVTFFSILLFMIFSYTFTINRFITRFTEKQLNDDYNSILSDTCETIEDLLWNLTLTSGQILDNEEIKNTLILYQSSVTPYEKQTHYSSLLNSITMLTLANTDISLLYLYDTTMQDFIFSSFPVKSNEEIQVPVLYQNSAFSFCGPCQSQSNYNGNPVLILYRNEALPNGKTVTLSIESGFYSLLAPIRLAERKSAFLAITNASKELVYTTFPPEYDSENINDILEKGNDHSYRSLSRSMPQGWSVHLIIPEHVYKQNYYQSLTDVLICTVILTAFICLTAVYFWKSIYAPLQLFDRQLESLLSDNDNAMQIHSSIPEYDYLLQKIRSMQHQIQEMIQHIIQQEKTNAKIQIEKLRAQINPHFLLNTLNTVHWMALMNEQTEIDTITQSLSHLLSYNLDKDSIFTNLEKELCALKEYIQLQKVRYDFQFRIEKPCPEQNLNYPCPKFLLQPLVENSLSHGYRPGMEILIQIQIDDFIHLTLSDTGTGMEPETLTKINTLHSPSSRKSDPDLSTPTDHTLASGIGLAYVINSMHDFFSDNFYFSLDSSKDCGTIVTIKFPKLKGSVYHVKNTDHR